MITYSPIPGENSSEDTPYTAFCFHGNGGTPHSCDESGRRYNTWEDFDKLKSILVNQMRCFVRTSVSDDIFLDYRKCILRKDGIYFKLFYDGYFITLCPTDSKQDDLYHYQQDDTYYDKLEEIAKEVCARWAD